MLTCMHVQYACVATYVLYIGVIINRLLSELSSNVAATYVFDFYYNYSNITQATVLCTMHFLDI